MLDDSVSGRVGGLLGFLCASPPRKPFTWAIDGAAEARRFRTCSLGVSIPKRVFAAFSGKLE